MLRNDAVHVVADGDCAGCSVHGEVVESVVLGHERGNPRLCVGLWVGLICRFHLAERQTDAKIGYATAFGKEHLLAHQIDQFQGAVVVCETVDHRFGHGSAGDVRHRNEERRTTVDDKSGAKGVSWRGLNKQVGLVGERFQTAIVASFQLVVDAFLHGTRLHQPQQVAQVGLGLIEPAHGECSLCQDQVVFLGLRNGDRTLVSAAHLEVFRVKEVEPWQRLEPVAPDGFLGSVQHTVLAVELHLAAECGRFFECLLRMADGLVALTQPVGGPGSQRVHKGTVVGRLRQRQCFVEYGERLRHLRVPFLCLSPVLHGQCAEEIAGEHKRIGLDAEQAEAVGRGGILVGGGHGCQSVVGHLAQFTHVALQFGHVGIGVEQLRNVEHLARTCIVVEIVVREYLHEFHEVRHVECQLFLGSVQPCLHGIVRIEKRFFVYVGVDNLIRLHQIATCQHANRHSYDDIPECLHFFFFLK